MKRTDKFDKLFSNTNTAGGKMKDTNSIYWKTPNLNATNESGFSGLPGGVRTSNGNFEYIRKWADGGVLKMHIKIMHIQDRFIMTKKAP